MVHSLQSWPQLTRNGVPDQFRVIRMPLLLDGREVQVGETVGLDVMVNRARLRMLYEQRRVEPIGVPERRTPPPITLSQPVAQPVAQTVPQSVDSIPFTDPIPVAEEAANPRYQPRQRKGVRA